MTKKHCAFLSMDDTSGWSIDADLAIAPLEDLGWQVETVPWRASGVDWDRYDAVYIGTPWDYPQDPARFIRVLEEIDRSRAVLVNDFALVRWGIPKTYLRDLEAKGAAIVPSLWLDRLGAGQLATFFDALPAERIVVKPVISTNAADTFPLERHEASSMEPQLLATFADRALVVQPFIGNILSDGEYSLFYLGGRFSHAIRKVPQSGDFRVQEEHGASIAAMEPDDAMLRCADAIVSLVEPRPLYARCDLVRDDRGQWLLMELELIEPSMYLRMNSEAPRRFAVEFDRYVEERRRPFAERENL